jgi:phytanoyl-CoA hydroxylase
MTTEHHLTEPVQLFGRKAGPSLASVDLARYRRDGFDLLEDFLSAEELGVLRAETTRICRDEFVQPVSAGGASDGAVPDAEVLRQFLCIHFPHKLSPVMADLVSHPRTVANLVEVIGPDVKAMQSMMFVKAEGKPGQAWHQDEYFIPTRDRSLTAVWIALDDATVSNGCLWVLPGSHQAGVIYPERQIDDNRFDCTSEAYRFPYRDEDSVPVEVAAGSAVIFNGYLLHRSLPNTAAGSLRRAVVNHYMSAQSLLPWRPPRDGEHMAMVDDRDIILVAGTDPYAYKGLEERHRAYVRPDREGGCER